MKKIFLFCFLFIATISYSQANDPMALHTSNLSQSAWVDSVFKSLNNREKIAQLIVIRALPNDTGILKTADLISTFNIGALCFFQGGPIRQAMNTNYYQSLAKTPLLITTE